jgi:hypothetical protein
VAVIVEGGGGVKAIVEVKVEVIVDVRAVGRITVEVTV